MHLVRDPLPRPHRRTVMTRPLLVGIGNPWRGDDGIGWAVAEAAGRRLGDAVDVVCCDGEPTRLLDAWADADFAVVVDAARTGAAPGTLHLWTEGLPTRSVSSAGGSHASRHRVHSWPSVRPFTECRSGLPSSGSRPASSVPASRSRRMSRPPSISPSTWSPDWSLVVSSSEGPEYPGRDDVARAASQLSARLPSALTWTRLGCLQLPVELDSIGRRGVLFDRSDPLGSVPAQPGAIAARGVSRVVGPRRQRRRAGRSGRRALPRRCRWDFPACARTSARGCIPSPFCAQSSASTARSRSTRAASASSPATS